ncbi:ParA family protein [Borreliella burgdorferi]|uniref:ParA family protein n=1 Tax=Borreliella burgdorferi TaxID=139 RepID=UPI000D031435|nr:ParA family protein [Borreliella burgdorferi]PRR05691.1 ParA family protein [Borreliella burgdorferi]
MDRKESNIITIASPKGGVGKTTLTILFSYILKDLSKKVLLIDLDPQNSLSSYFSKYIFNIDKCNSYSLLKKDVYFGQCINKINDFISIIPSHPILENFNSEILNYKDLLLENILNRNITNYNFDYILLDTPPNLGFILKNSLNVTDYIIIPVQVERFSVESLSILMQTINDIKDFRNKSFNISIIENQFLKNRNTFKDVEELLYKEYSFYIKGKIHYYNSVKVLINELLEPSVKETYYEETKNTLENIINLQF